MLTGAVATLAGDRGFGWAEAIAIRGGRVVAAGSRAEVEATAGRQTRRIELAPGEVAIPGLTDAHLHLADAALAARSVDLGSALTAAAGLRRIAAAHAAEPDPEAWLLGHGWDRDRWGGWPSAAALEANAPGRRAAFWAHDHHALWVSATALQVAGIGPGTPDPAGGSIRRGDQGLPAGVLHESASALVTARIPAPTADRYAEAIPALARELVRLGVVAVHDPGGLAADPGLVGAHRAYARLSETDLPLRVHACLRSESLPTAAELGLRSGDSLGPVDGRVRVGWLKLFADGTLGSRTAALLEPFEPEPGSRAGDPPNHGIWIMPPDRLGSLAEDAARLGIASQIHAIGDAAVRAALDALGPTVGRTALQPRVEHSQLVDPADLPRFAALGVAASVQPVHVRSDAGQARRLWGPRAERSGYAWRSLLDAGATIAFGTDAPVEPIDPWPGLAMAVTRRSPDWEPDMPAFGPTEALDLATALRLACIGGPTTAGEADRGRLVPGQRADLAVVPADALAEPVAFDGPLGRVRPRLVLVDGQVAHEA